MVKWIESKQTKINFYKYIMNIKKYLRLLPILPFLLNSLHLVFADDNDIGQFKKYIVTAYYSPLPDQQFYLRWNFEDEVRLNWEGKRWASWKAVYPWMLAAPKTYAFGTKLFLEWIWIGTVDDRWWAIVGSGSRWYDGDRVDIWMWYWDDGLKRALTWWKRTVYWRIIADNEEDVLPSIAVENFKIWQIDFESLKNARLVWKNSSETKVVTVQNLVPANISLKSSADDILLAQKIFNQLWYYSWTIDWVYRNDLNKSILGFQLDNWVVSSVNAKGAWWYWEATKKALNSKYLTFLNQEKIRIIAEKKKQDDLVVINNKVALITKWFWAPKDNEVWAHVRRLQKTLKLLWYFQNKDTAIYWPQTKDSLIKYQIQKWLIQKSTDLWAWRIGEKTIWKIQEDLKLLAVNNSKIIKDLES
jgi:peptidoglycan hydrolase-like protein with peptidoglycan-binding domain/3D (Asp-Asp-Asp) domain-containing protein